MGGIMWNQAYDSSHRQSLSTLMAAIPVVTLLVPQASGKVQAHLAALIALAAPIPVPWHRWFRPVAHEAVSVPRRQSGWAPGRMEATDPFGHCSVPSGDPERGRPYGIRRQGGKFHSWMA